MFHVIAWQTKARQVRRRLRFLPNGCIQLSREGLKYPGDYEFVLAGVHATRWAALQAGEIDCAPQPAPWNFIAENAGYNLIGDQRRHTGSPVCRAYRKESWLEVNSETVGKLLKALAEAYLITNDPSQEEEIALPIFQRITVPDDADLARRGLRYMRDMGMWPNGPAIPERAIETTIDLMIQAGLLDEGTRMSAVGVFDNSYLQEALA
jgi:NitT/TauT family transport system substrate-binding protein